MSFGIEIFSDYELKLINSVSSNKIIDDDMRTYAVHRVRFANYTREAIDKELVFFTSEEEARNAVIELNKSEIDYNKKNGPGYMYYYRERILDSEKIRKN